MYCRTANADTVYLSGDDGYSAQTTVTTDNQYIFDMGTRKKEVPIRIEVPVNDAEGNVELFVVKQHDDVYKKAYDKLSKNPMTITKFEDTAVEGTVNIDKGQMLYTSINYDEGWSVTVDGKPVNYSSDQVCRIGDALTGIHLAPGKHTIAFRYHAAGLRSGLVLSLAGALALCALTVLPARRRKKLTSSSGHKEADHETVE